MATSHYTAATKEATVIDGVEVSITVEDVGGDERKADQVLMDLQERIGILQTAYEKEVPPSELDDVPTDYTPMMAVSWESVFESEDE